ncbi:MAG: glutamate-1-semialdehyde 2,1-aminomutase [Smithellaceae bacterium]|nr:glutamate-1-semialdehyde 2,1-aminomutase [Smithellaceae bacterium]
MKTSETLFAQAKKLIPGGVNSPVRSGSSVGVTPRFISHASGSMIYDADGRDYIDYVLSWGPMILGHAHPAVVEAIRAAAGKGTSYGAPTELETRMAAMICEAFPSVEMVRFVSSGTEATMSALRLARGYTGRDKIVKFTGCYHGHGDSLLVKAGSGLVTLGIPGSPGIPRALAELTISLPYNDQEAVRGTLDRWGDEISCLIVEPVAGNMGVVPPEPGFLQFLRKITREKGIVLIFDEVITGFRFTYGGCQNLFGIEPDLTCLGKIIGGGLPVGAFGGRREIMECLAPLGPVYQAGTLSGNPLAMSAGIATLEILKGSADQYKKIDADTASFCGALRGRLAEAGIAGRINRAGSMFTLFFTDREVIDYETAILSNTAAYAGFYREMLALGIYLAPSQFEAAFVSFAHTSEDLGKTLEACDKALKRL